MDTEVLKIVPTISIVIPLYIEEDNVEDWGY